MHHDGTPESLREARGFLVSRPRTSIKVNLPGARAGYSRRGTVPPARLMEYFNRLPGFGIPGTAGADGTADAAISGLPRLTDEETVIMDMGTNRTFLNIRENPTRPSRPSNRERHHGLQRRPRPRLARGAATSGPALEDQRVRPARPVGKACAAMIRLLATFEVTGARPIMEMGQSRERSVRPCPNSRRVRLRRALRICIGPI